jgi:hypothetical protein
MKTAIEQKITPSRDEIANLAWQLWEKEGSQHGRDQEYWFRAEQQLLAAKQPQPSPTFTSASARRIAPAKGKGAARL